MTDNYVIYHDDPDGWCCGAIVAKHLRKSDESLDRAEFIPASYGRKMDPKDFPEDSSVYMVDFSLPAEDMLAMMKRVRRFIWIDHHASAIDAWKTARMAYLQGKYKNLSKVVDVDNLDDIPGTREVGLGACELAWEYLYGAFCVERGPMPQAVKLVGTYDTWRREEPLWEDALAFQYGIRTESFIHDPKSGTWHWLLADKCLETEKLVKAGYLVKKYQDGINAHIAKRSACVTEIPYCDPDGRIGLFPAVAINSPYCNSMLFDSLDIPSHTLKLSYYWSAQGVWTVSVYCDPSVDGLNVSKYYGGGGHRGASGFTCRDLPFKLTDIKWEAK